MDPSQSNYHSMANPGQSVEDAINGRNKIVGDELDAARAEWSLGHTDLALYELAIATHALMDMTSPAHVDAIGPIMWCGTGGCSAKQDPSGRSKGNASKHSPWEGKGIEDASHITPAIFKENDEYIRFSYSYMTRKACNCK